MAKQVKLISPTDETLFNLKNHFVDCVKSHTIITNQDGFSRFRIFDQIDNFDIDNNRVRINYSTGAYLLIKP